MAERGKEQKRDKEKDKENKRRTRKQKERKRQHKKKKRENAGRMPSIGKPQTSALQKQVTTNAICIPTVTQNHAAGTKKNQATSATGKSAKTNSECGYGKGPHIISSTITKRTPQRGSTNLTVRNAGRETTKCSRTRTQVVSQEAP